MNALAVIHALVTVVTPAPFVSDTPPAPPPVEQLARLRTMNDVIGVTLLENGTAAPTDITLPQIENRRHTLEYMRVHYPEKKRDVISHATPLAWVHVTATGQVGDVRLLNTSGHEEMDALSLEVMRMAVFKPAVHNGKPIGVWVPFPARIPPYHELIATLKASDQPLSEAPQQVAYTQKPVLLNRNQVEAAIIRIIHQASSRMREINEAFARSQNAGGTTHMNIFIDQEGVVRNALVSKTSGVTDLDQSAISIAKMMRFSPAKNGDRPVEVWIEVPIRFKTN
jgi:TonB family protein